jgi:hypothetical protein
VVGCIREVVGEFCLGKGTPLSFFFVGLQYIQEIILNLGDILF